VGWGQVWLNVLCIRLNVWRRAERSVGQKDGDGAGRGFY